MQRLWGLGFRVQGALNPKPYLTPAKPSKPGVLLPGRPVETSASGSWRPMPTARPTSRSGLGFRVQSSGFRVQGSGFRV